MNWTAGSKVHLNAKRKLAAVKVTSSFFNSLFFPCIINLRTLPICRLWSSFLCLSFSLAHRERRCVGPRTRPLLVYLCLLEEACSRITAFHWLPLQKSHLPQSSLGITCVCSGVLVCSFYGAHWLLWGQLMDQGVQWFPVFCVKLRKGNVLGLPALLQSNFCHCQCNLFIQHNFFHFNVALTETHAFMSAFRVIRY